MHLYGSSTGVVLIVRGGFLVGRRSAEHSDSFLQQMATPRTGRLHSLRNPDTDGVSCPDLWPPWSILLTSNETCVFRRACSPGLTAWTSGLAPGGTQLQHPGAWATAVLPVWISTTTGVGERTTSAVLLVSHIVVIDRVQQREGGNSG